MYSEELEQLIKAALTDGVLTEKERQILFKRAKAEGVDLDEFEMILDARVYELNKMMNHVQQPAPGDVAAPSNSSKHGDVKKCPACGAIVQPFTTTCTDCGYDFNNVQANASFDRLYKMLVQVENERTRDTETKGGSIFSVFKTLLSEEMDDDKINKKKINIIHHFPIPTTKGDILEFLSQAAPLAKVKGFFSSQTPAEKDLALAWKAKCEQIIIKAKFSMKEDKDTLETIREYANELKIKF